MNDFQSLISGGFREMAVSNAGITVRWQGKDLRAIQGSGVSYDGLIAGGELDHESIVLQILKTDLAAAHDEPVQQEDEFLVDGQVLRVKSVSNDAADPCLRITLQGPEQ